MNEDHKSEVRAKKNAEEGQKLTNDWHKRMAELDLRAPKAPKPKDDAKRGCVSPLGGKVW
jgi:hypothetical protein